MISKSNASNFFEALLKISFVASFRQPIFPITITYSFSTKYLMLTF